MNDIRDAECGDARERLSRPGVMLARGVQGEWNTVGECGALPTEIDGARIDALVGLPCRVDARESDIQSIGCPMTDARRLIEMADGVSGVRGVPG